MANNPDQILEATEGFVCEIDGERYIVQHMITRVHASHPLAQRFPQHFRPIEDDLSYVDDATATNEPGQIAGRSRVVRQKATHIPDEELEPKPEPEEESPAKAPARRPAKAAATSASKE